MELARAILVNIALPTQIVLVCSLSSGWFAASYINNCCQTCVKRASPLGHKRELRSTAMLLLVTGELPASTQGPIVPQGATKRRLNMKGECKQHERWAGGCQGRGPGAGGARRVSPGCDGSGPILTADKTSSFAPERSMMDATSFLRPGWPSPLLPTNVMTARLDRRA